MCTVYNFAVKIVCMYITLAYVMRCTEMFTNNERCPYAPIASQDVACFDSVFPEDFYYQSPDTICEYELLFIISGWQNCKSSGLFKKVKIQSLQMLLHAASAL